MRINSSTTVLGAAFALASLSVLLVLNRNGQPADPVLVDVYQVDRSMRPAHSASYGALQSYGPRASIQDNLKPDLDYLISFAIAGFNNQVMCVLNRASFLLLFREQNVSLWAPAELAEIDAAMQSGRIPILVPFRSDGSHAGEDGAEIPVGDIFDLSSLSGALGGLPIVEFRELKATRNFHTGKHNQVDVEAISGRLDVQQNSTLHQEAPLSEPLGCWSLSMGTQGNPIAFTPAFGLELDLTPLPSETWGRSEGGHRADLILLAEHLRPRRGRSEYSLPESSKMLLEKFGNDIPELSPDDHVACVDHMYYFSDDPSRYDCRETYRNGVGTWARVGQHMRYKASWLKLAQQHLRTIFDVPEGAPVPPYIGVHIRRGDFDENQRSITPRAWAYAVFRVQKLLEERMGISVRNVLITTNEKDPAWLSQFDAYEGFRVVDHVALGTTAIDPIWHPTILDTVFLSTGIGFVGLRDSTMAILAQKRVILWKGGVGLLIAPGLADVPDGWEYPY